MALPKGLPTPVSLPTLLACTLEVDDELAGRPHAVVERDRELHQAAQIGLANELALAELLGWLLEPARVFGEAANPGGDRGRVELAQPFDEPPRRFAAEERCPLERDLRLVKRLLEVDQPRVRAAQDRHLLERHILVAKRRRASDHELDLRLARREGTKGRLRPASARRAPSTRSRPGRQRTNPV